MKKMMLITLILLLFISCCSVYAEENVSSEIMTDTNSDSLHFNSDDSQDLGASELDNLEQIEESYDLDELGNFNTRESKLEDASEGEYVDASEAYGYLNAFRTEENVWYWNWDDTTQSHVNTNDTVWLKPLERDVELENTAKIRAKEISEYFSHARPDGTICFEIFPDGLLDYGENIAFGYETCFDVTEGWKETNESYSGQGHRRTMLQADFNYVGIAGYRVNGTTYWVQNFGCRYDPQDIKAKSRFYFKDNTASPEFGIEVPRYATGSFNVIINGNEISSKSISNGKSNIVVCGLSPGTYDVCLSYSGDYNCNPLDETKTIVVPDYDSDDTPAFNYLNTMIRMADGEIKLEKDYVYDSSLDSSFKEGIIIDTPLTIDGQGHTIDGKNMARIFKIFSSGVTFKNINIINGNANITPSNENRYFDDSSYGITCYYNAYIKPNKDGGAIYSYSPFTVINSTFSNNKALNGGAVYSAAYLTMENSGFTDNKADDCGGAIYSTDYVYVKNTSFTGNYALDLGGAIYSTSTLESTDSIYKNNNNLGIFVKEFIDNDNTFINDEYMNLFVNASADNGIVTLNKDYKATGTVLITASNVIIDGNGYTIDAQNKSRAFYITADNVTIKNIKIINGNSNKQGGAVYDTSSGLTVINSTFSNCIAQSGGAIYGNTTNIVIRDSSFSNNNVKDFSGSEITEGGAISTVTGTVNVLNSSFANNSAYYGGAIHTDSGLITIRDSCFKNNSAPYYAGGSVHTGADVNIENSTFTDNYASDYGGAVFCYGESILHVKDSTFINNTSHHYGGAISAAVGAEIMNSLFSDNSASDHGGVMSIWGNLTVKDSNFTDNVASVAGAIFDYSETSSVSIISSNFINNTQKTYGALYLTVDAQVKDSTFINNGAKDGVGGAICCMLDLTVADSIFINNSAVRFEGYSVGGAIVEYGENLNVEHCLFANNSAIRGGAIANFAGNARVDHSIFINNSAEVDGGGIFNYYNTELSVLNSNFENNSAMDGGATYECDAVNCTFTDNRASNIAGAMYGVSNTADSCKFIRNVAYGDNPTYGVVTDKCTFKDNMIIIRASFNTNYMEPGYYPGDKLYVYLEDTDFISNATITLRAYENNKLADTFEFMSGEGWIVNISEGNYTFEFSVENQCYEATPMNKTVAILKKEIADANITIDDIIYSNPAIVDLVSNLDGNVEIYVDDAYFDYLNVAANEHAQITLNYILAGNHTLTATIIPSNYHFDSKTFTENFTVFKKPTAVELDVENTTTDENVIITVKASENGFVNVTVADESQTAYVNANTETQINFGIWNWGIYGVNAIFSVDENYIDSNASKTLRVYSIISQDDIKITNPQYGSDEIVIELPSDATGTVTLTIDDENYNADIVDGIANVKLPNLTAGNYKYDIIYSGDGKYIGFNTSGSLNVEDETKENITVKPDVVIPSLDNGNGEVLLPSDATGTVTLTVNGKDYNFDVVGGVANVKVPDLANGDYPYTITYSGDAKYSALSQNGTLKINKTSTTDQNQTGKTNNTNTSNNDTKPTVKPEITIPPLDKPASDGSITVTLPNDATGLVTLTINGKNYNYDIKNGEAKVIIPDLGNGNYPYTITYSGDTKYSVLSQNGTLKINKTSTPDQNQTGKTNNTNTSNNDTKPTVKPEITIPPLDKPASDGSITVKLPNDATGKITLTINSKNYEYPVDNGEAKVIIPELDNGNYPYTITYSGDGKYLAFSDNGSLKVNETDDTPSKENTTELIDPTIKVSDVEATYATGALYTITVTGADGKPANRVDVVVTLNGNAFETLKTDSNGIASFEIGQKPGTYKLSASSLGKTAEATLTVKHLLKLKKVKVKKSAKKLVLTATLGKVNGKYLKGAKIKFKFNGKKYKVKTNKKGVAKATVKSNVLKKLKVGQSISYQAKYAKDTVKKTVKVKK